MIAAPVAPAVRRIPALPRLPARLEHLVDLIPADSAQAPIADIGAGHGLLAAHLAARGATVIATEAALIPWTELRANLARWGVTAAVQTRHGRGLDPLRRSEVRLAIAAGIGSRALLDIVVQAPDRGVPRLLLQCVQHPEQVDAWLDACGWPVRARTAPADRGRIYPTWLVEVPQ